jgi:Cu(I)/Ag(I) efflux system membrane fusion protein
VIFTVAHQINAGLAADDVKAFNAHVEHLGHAIEDAAQKLAKTGLAGAVQKVHNSFRLQTAKDLESARKEYATLSGAIAEFAQALRRGGVPVSTKVFQCPMYPAPGKTAYWVQTEAPLRNPFYGSAMLDCGTEVK